MNNIYKEIQALNKSDLLPRAKTLYLALMEIADSKSKCKPILASLEFKSGLSESTVIRATKELEAAGFISVVRFNKRGPSTLPNVYTLTHRTAQSSQIDSTSPVKLTGKNTTTSLTTNACHHDTRGVAPSVMDDRLEEYKKIISILEKHQTYFTEEQVAPLAQDVVSQIGLEGLDSKLQENMDHHHSQGYRPPPIQDRLKSILEEVPKQSVNVSQT